METDSERQAEQQAEYPTSPWTEAFQARPADWAGDESSSAMSQRPQDAEPAAPTHAALSAIYNQGY